MRTIVFGTGGVGGYFGGLLAKDGQDVGFVARGAHLDALRSHGLRVRSVHGDFEVPVRASEDPAELGAADLVLFCVKSYDTESAAQALRGAIGPDTAVISLQNGVDNEDKISAVLGPGHAMGGVAYIESTIAEPGVIAQMSPMARIAFGELDGQRTARAQRILEAFQSAKVDAVLAEDILVALWSKYLYITPVAGMTTLTGQSLGPVMQCPETAAVFRTVAEEVAAVGRASGVAIPDDAVDKACKAAASAPAAMKSSMQRDMERGRTIEVEALNGTAVRLGGQLGVPTPVNACIHACLKLMAASR
jgi:2-dehydropantoate 2-reductase